MATLGGMLATASSEIRDLLDEPQQSAKLPDATCLKRMGDSYLVVLSELARQSKRAFVMEWQITLDQTAGTVEKYLLPVQCGQITRAWFTDSADQVLQPIARRRLDGAPLTSNETPIAGFGYEVRGPYLYLLRPQNFTLPAYIRIEFIPQGRPVMHYGTITSSDRTSTTVTLRSATGITGEKDYRPNSYIGHWFRNLTTATNPSGWTSGVIVGQDRPISGFAGTTEIITVSPAFDFTDGGNWTYEVVPTADYNVWRAVVLHTAWQQAAVWGRVVRTKGLRESYNSHLRSVRMVENTADTSSGMQAQYQPRYYTNRLGIKGW